MADRNIDEYRKSREESIGALFAVMDEDPSEPVQVEDWNEALDAETARERLEEMPLSVEVVRTVRILLGTGGPADWIDAELDDEGDVRRVRYTYEDWGTHADALVDQRSPLWRMAEHYAEVAAYQED
jgi:hypothetical protein